MPAFLSAVSHLFAIATHGLHEASCAIVDPQVTSLWVLRSTWKTNVAIRMNR